MVIKDIPADTVAVGIPARLVKDNSIKTSTFRPYAVAKDEGDPMVKSVNALLEKVAKQEKALDDLSAKILKITKK